MPWNERLRRRSVVKRATPGGSVLHAAGRGLLHGEMLIASKWLDKFIILQEDLHGEGAKVKPVKGGDLLPGREADYFGGVTRIKAKTKGGELK